MKSITIQMLKSIHACQPEIHRFRKLFGEEAEVTLANCRLAVKKLSVSLFLEKFLSKEEYSLYNESRELVLQRYIESIDQAFKFYYESRESAWELYCESKESAWELYCESITKILYTTLINK